MDQAIGTPVNMSEVRRGSIFMIADEVDTQGIVQLITLYHRDPEKSDGSLRVSVTEPGRRGARHYRVYRTDVVTYRGISPTSGLPIFSRARVGDEYRMNRLRRIHESELLLGWKPTPHTCPVCDNECPQ